MIILTRHLVGSLSVLTFSRELKFHLESNTLTVEDNLFWGQNPNYATTEMQLVKPGATLYLTQLSVWAEFSNDPCMKV